MLLRLRRLINALARCVLVVLAAEITLRGHSWWTGEQRFYSADAQLGWRVSANLTRTFGGGSGAYLVQTNSKGFRDAEHAERKPEGSFRVVVLGASTIFGDGVAQDELCTERLEGMLPATDVINLACLAYSPTQHAVILRAEGWQYEPDVVLQFLIQSDENCSFQSWEVTLQRPKCCLVFNGSEISIRPPDFARWQRALHYSYLAERFVLFGLPLAAAAPGLFTPQPTLTDAEKLAALRLLIMRTWHDCRDRGIEYRAVYLPAARELDDEGVTQDRFVRDRLLMRMAEQDALPVVDLSAALRQAHADPQRGPLTDSLGLHINGRGHEVVAGELAKAMLPVARRLRSERAPVQSATPR